MKIKRQPPSKKSQGKKKLPVALAKRGTRAKKVAKTPAKPSKGKKQLPAARTRSGRGTKRAPVTLASPSKGKQQIPVLPKSPDPTRDATPTTIDSRLERMAGTSQLTQVGGAGRAHS